MELAWDFYKFHVKDLWKCWGEHEGLSITAGILEHQEFHCKEDLASKKFISLQNNFNVKK